MSSSGFVTVNGLKLHYLDHGNESGSPLVCIHGLSGNAHNFDALATHLSGKFHVMAIDVRGRGDSEWGPPGDYNTTTYMNDLSCLLESLGLDRVTLIGTSMGGMVAMLFAGGYPDRVERLVLNDVGPEIEASGAARISKYMSSGPTGFASLREVAEYYRGNYPPLRSLPESQLLDFVKWAVRPTVDGRFEWKMDPAVRNIPRSGTAARTMDMWVPYARITAPVLVVRGAESDILSRATSDRMRVVQRRTSVVEVPGVGHAPSMLEPESLNAITEFLL